MEEKIQTVREITTLTGGFMPAQIVLTANRLEVFTHLSGTKLTGQQLAERLNTDARATELLCNALTALGFLQKKGGLFWNSAKADEHLVQGQPFYCGDNLRHQANYWHRWSQLEEVIKTGEPLPKKVDSPEEEKQQAAEFTLAMANIGRLSAAQTAAGLDLRNVRKMIDIGGGPGTYALEFVKKNPDLQVVVFDRPPVAAVAEESIRKSTFQKNITYRAGDCFVDNLGSDYDLAFLSNFIHIYSLEEIVVLFRRIWPALKSSGKLVVKDFFVNDERTGPPFAAQFALHMLINTERGSVYSLSEMQTALKEAQFQCISHFEVGEHSTVIVAEKAD
ncbi:MAG: methyltransferase [bacterium]